MSRPYNLYGFGNIDETVTGPDGQITVALPDNWYDMSLQEQEAWLAQSTLSPTIAGYVEDQLSIGPGPGAVPPPVAMVKTPFGTFKQSDVLLYGGIGLLCIVALAVVGRN